MTKSNIFDIIAHVDLIKIFRFKPKQDISEMLSKTAGEIAKHRLRIELNTRGLSLVEKFVLVNNF